MLFGAGIGAYPMKCAGDDGGLIVHMSCSRGSASESKQFELRPTDDDLRLVGPGAGLGGERHHE